MNQNSCESTKSWPQILIFPEGTCTNGQALIKYKTGAFQVYMIQHGLHLFLIALNEVY